MDLQEQHHSDLTACSSHPVHVKEIAAAAKSRVAQDKPEDSAGLMCYKCVDMLSISTHLNDVKSNSIASMRPLPP